MMTKVLLFITLICFMFGCNTHQNQMKDIKGNTLENHQWLLKSYSDKGVTIDVIEEQYGFVFSNAKLSGAICNQINSAYKIPNENQISFGLAMSTRKLCREEKKMNTEIFFVANLSKVTTYQFVNKDLILKIDDLNQMVFTHQ